MQAVSGTEASFRRGIAHTGGRHRSIRHGRKKRQRIMVTLIVRSIARGGGDLHAQEPPKNDLSLDLCDHSGWQPLKFGDVYASGFGRGQSSLSDQ